MSKKRNKSSSGTLGTSRKPNKLTPLHSLSKLLIVIILIGVFVGLFLYFGARPAGKAAPGSTYNIPPPLGFYWEKQPVKGQEFDQSIGCPAGYKLFSTEIGVDPTNSDLGKGCCNLLKTEACGIHSSPLSTDDYTCYYKSTVIEGDSTHLCTNYDADTELEFLVCGDKHKNAIYGKKFLCDGTQWSVCTGEVKNAKVPFTTPHTHICDGTQWVACFNKYCPLPSDLSASPVFNTLNIVQYLTGSSFVQSIKAGGIPLKGTSLLDTVDLAENQTYYHHIVTSQAAPFPSSYFKFNKKNYQVKLVNLNVTEGIAKLEVSSVGGEKKSSLEISVDPVSSTFFAPKQYGISLEGDASPELYFNAIFGFFNKNKHAGILFTVVPTLNFDKHPSSLALISSAQQKFIFDGQEHSLKTVLAGANQVLLIDDEEYTEMAGTHYFDKNKLKGVQYEIKAQFSNLEGAFAVIKLAKSVEEKEVIFEEEEEILENFPAEVKIKAADLAKVYEGSFNQTKAVNIPNVGILYICTDDPKVLSTVKVCDGTTKNIFNLVDEKEKWAHTLPSVGPRALFLYAAPKANETKHVKTFHLLALGENPNQPADIFANNLVAGKRVALRLGNKFYLLSHPAAAFLDLTKLELVDVTDKDTETYKAEGNQEKVVFNLPLAQQISINLNLQPELRYDLSGQILAEKIVKIEDELQAKVSTYSLVRVDGKNTVLSQNDIKTFKDKMKIKYGQDEIELAYKKPKVIGNVLFYYAEFTAGGLNKFTKYADIYLFYNLTQKEGAHKFTDDAFILPFAKGGNIAFELEGTFYLLHYAEPWGQNAGSGFELAKLQLVPLDSGSSSVPSVKEEKAIFDFIKNRIEITVDTNAQTISFVGITASVVAEEQKQALVNTTTFIPGKDFRAALTPSTMEQTKKLLVGEREYSICDTPATKAFQNSVLLCDAPDDNAPLELKMNQPVLKENVLIWYKNYNSGQKLITFQHLINLSTAKKLSWLNLTENLKQGKNPAIAWAGQLFELTGGEELASFAIRNITTGELYFVQPLSEEEGFKNATLAFNENLLHFQQQLVKFDIQLTMKPLDFYLATLQGFNVTEPKTQKFTPIIGGAVYSIQPKAQGAFIQIVLKKGDTLLIDKNMAEGDSRELVLDGIPIAIEVDFKDDKAIAVVKQK